MPNNLNASYEKRVQTELCCASSQHICEPEHKDQDKHQLKEHLLAGMRSGVEGAMDADFINSLRQTFSRTERVTVPD